MVDASKTPPEPAPVDAPPEKWFRFLGLVIIRKTDLLAGAAFFIAVSSSVYQLWGFMRGADVAMYHPDVVYIFFDQYASGIRPTRLAGQVSFTNSGDIGRNAIVRTVEVSMEVAGNVSKQEWLSFANITREGTVFHIAPREPAHPIVVLGGSAGSEMMAFAPRKRDCAIEAAITRSSRAGCDADADYVSDDAFLEKVMTADVLELTFVATLFDSRKVLRTSCVVPITKSFTTILASNDWIAATCLSSVARSP